MIYVHHVLTYNIYKYSIGQFTYLYRLWSSETLPLKRIHTSNKTISFNTPILSPKISDFGFEFFVYVICLILANFCKKNRKSNL